MLLKFIIKPPIFCVANKQAMLWLLKINKEGASLNSSGRPFHRTEAMMEKAWALVDDRWATLSGGTDNKRLPEDRNWCTGTYGSKQSS